MENKMNIEEYTSQEIVDIIKTNGWEHKKDFPIDRFVQKVAKNKYAVDGKFILQSKPEAIDYNFVDRQVRRAKSGKYFPNDAVFVYFPVDVEIDGEKIVGGSYRLIDRTHGMVIDATLGYTNKSANIVNFEKHLGSDEGKLWRLANKLNDPIEEENQGLPDGAIKGEIWRLMDRRVKVGEDATPSKKERESFLEDYAQLDLRQYSAHVSNHEYGGRRKTTIMHTKEELKAHHKDLKKDSTYEGYYIAPPAHVAAWDTAIGSALQNKEVTIDKTNKILMCFHSTSAAQTKKLESNFYQNAIEKKLKELKIRFGIDEFDYCLMDY
jgi:hypothetical protein